MNPRASIGDCGQLNSIRRQPGSWTRRLPLVKARGQTPTGSNPHIVWGWENPRLARARQQRPVVRGCHSAIRTESTALKAKESFGSCPGTTGNSEAFRSSESWNRSLNVSYLWDRANRASRLVASAQRVRNLKVFNGDYKIAGQKWR